MSIRPTRAILEDTGERMVPESTDAATFWAHVHRYRFAARFVRTRRVLDIACGEGYGTHALASAGALSVIGIDISEEVCEHARRKYGIDARLGSAEAIPLPDRSVEVVVSFETIEHVPSPATFLDECVRVLDSRGVLIISTPNAAAHNARRREPNPFHCSEMNEEEFAGMLRSRFPNVQLFSQGLRTAAWWSPRSLVAEESPWLRMRGYWRLTSYLCPYRRVDVDQTYRKSPVKAILATDGPLSDLVNPFSVRRRAEGSGELPICVVATALKA